MEIKRKKILKIALAVILLSLILTLHFFYSIRKIDLISSDASRHLKNGELMSESFFQGTGLWKDILYKNVYSYTDPGHSFINHHWASSVALFYVWKFWGFYGLSIFNILLRTITLFMVIFIAYRLSNFWIAAITTLALLPVASTRMEIRPEIFTYFFSPIVFWLLWQYRAKKISFHYLYIIPLLILSWVNLNLYYIIGLVLVFFFLAEELYLGYERRDKNWGNAKKLFLILALSLLATLANPSGIKGALYPFFITSDIGMKIQELQNAAALPVNININIVIIILAVIGFFGTFAIDQKLRAKVPLPIFWLTIFFLAFGLKYSRNITIFGYFIIIFLSCFVVQIVSRLKKQNVNAKYVWLGIAPVLFLFVVTVNLSKMSKIENEFGIGISPASKTALEYLSYNDLGGPVFNDFNCSSFLIFATFPKTRVFVDQRPEAYDPSFFRETYVPAIEDEEKWKDLYKKYLFHTVVMENKPEGKFVARRKKDPAWKVAFENDKLIIFKPAGQKL